MKTRPTKMQVAHAIINEILEVRSQCARQRARLTNVLAYARQDDVNRASELKRSMDLGNSAISHLDAVEHLASIMYNTLIKEGLTEGESNG